MCAGRDRVGLSQTLEAIAQGGRTGQLYVLRDGELEVLRDGKHITSIKTPGSVIGEMSVLLDAPQTATVRAVTEVDFFVIDNAIEVLRTHPEWLLQIARLLAQRVKHTTAQLTRGRDEEGGAMVLPQNFISSWGDPAV